MDRDEVLKKSREQKEDEGAVYVENKGRQYGVVGFCTVFAIILFFNLFTRQNNFVPYSMFFAYMAAEAYGKYRIGKQKALIVTMILAAVAAVLFLVCHIFVVLGIGV